MPDCPAATRRVRPQFPLAFVLLAVCPSIAAAQDRADPAQLAQVRVAEEARVRLVEKLAPAVVCVFPKGNRAGGGSGVLIHPSGYGLTNYHVVASLGDARQGDGGMWIAAENRGQTFPLEVLGFDAAGDIAMFKLTSDRPLPFAPLGDSDALAVGDWTLAMGNPFLLAEDLYPTVTFGIVSGLHRYLAGHGRQLIYTDCIQIDTSINPGNSGGPLFNMAGEVIGINGRIGIEERGRVNVGVGYAISANQIRRFMPALRAGLVTKHATLGATVFDKSLGVVVVDQILETSDAYRAGLRLRDQVIKLDGVAIRSANQLLNMVGALPARWPVELVVRRGDESKSLRFRLGALPLPRRPRAPKGVPEDVERAMKALAQPNWVANLREVRRTLDAALNALGGCKASAALKGWTMKIERRAAREDAAKTLEIRESHADAALLTGDAAASAEPHLVETAVRWSLFGDFEDLDGALWKVTGVDDIGGRLVLVIERVLPADRTILMSIDDETGQLLRVAFDDPRSGKPVRYEYADFKRVGPLRLPHRRVLFVGDDFLFEDAIQYDTIGS